MMIKFIRKAFQTIQKQIEKVKFKKELTRDQRIKVISKLAKEHGIEPAAAWAFFMVESGGKQFKSRFCGPGMRWSRPGLERLIPVRAAIMSDCFDSRWHAAYNSPPN